MTSRQYYQEVFFSTGFLLIATLATALILSSLCFFAGIPVSGWQLPLSFLLSAAIYRLSSKTSGGILIRAVIFCIALTGLSILLAISFYDVSYDGQSYHMEGIYQLKNGWNPFKTLLLPHVNLAVYVNHYPKGAEIPQSMLYSLTHSIEAGKATNFMLLAAAFCLSQSFLFSINSLSLLKCTLISAIAALNPVVITQLFTTYTDGQLALLLLSFIIIALYIARSAEPVCLILLGAIIIIGANLKFTGLVYMVLFSAALLIWLLITRQPQFRKVLAATFASGLIAVCLVGYNPYLMHITNAQHPFYPVMGEQKVDIMGHNLPEGFDHKGKLTKFMLSLFSRTDNATVSNHKVVTLKIPFTVRKEEIVSSYDVDTRIGGFGVLFSGVAILSLVLLVVIASVKSKPGASGRKAWWYGLISLAVSVMVIPESWWARYVPQLWYIPLLILLMAEVVSVRRTQGLRILVYGALIVNIAFTLFVIRFNHRMTGLINAQLQKMKDSGKPVAVQWGSAKANRIRFQENDVPYIEKDLSQAPDTEYMVYSDTRFSIAPANMNNQKKP